MVREREIVRCDAQSVSYRWRDAKTGKHQMRTLAGVEFLRLVLQHVLPKGLRRARCYGLLHPNCRRGVALRRAMALRRRPRMPADVAPLATTDRPKLLCHCCGNPMHIVRRRILNAVVASPPTTLQPAPIR